MEPSEQDKQTAHHLWWSRVDVDKKEVRIAQALAEAREQGRQAGLEEAAQSLEPETFTDGCTFFDLECRISFRDLQICREHIRALKQPKEEGTA